MKESSISFCTDRFICLSTGSCSNSSCEPPRLSSQFDDQEMVSIGRPSIWETGRAVGCVCSPFGAVSSLSYS